MLTASHRNLELPRTGILSCLPRKSKLFAYNLIPAFAFVFVFPKYRASYYFLDLRRVVFHYLSKTKGCLWN